MRLLFSVNNFGFLRNFEPALRQLAERGHTLHLLAERKDSVGGTRTIEMLQRAFPDRITWAYAPSRKNEFWQPLSVGLRVCRDYWRYLDPRYDKATSLRARAARQAPAFASTLPRVPLLGSGPAMRLWQAAFRSIERALPPGSAVEQTLRDSAPDLVLLTPLLYFGSQQVDYVRAARAMGIRTVLGVGSWDHLTTKGLIHEQPDRVIVWNEAQRQEAADLHGIAREHVTVTGAQAYDHWFTQRPSSNREAFSARVGVPADRPLLLYLCSSPFITPYEVGFVRQWIAAIRGAQDPDLRRAALLIRPHPQNAEQWRDFDSGFDEALAIWPRAGANPVDADARAEYYDSMYHSVAVVGVNTSALIESGIVGRPVFTVLAEEFAGQQEGTLHFQHLKNVNGGLLSAASSLDEHVTQLAEVIRGGHDASKGLAFIEAFIRPHGLEVRAADRFADAVEAEASAPRHTPRSTPLSVHMRRALAYPAAALARSVKPGKKAPVRDDKDAGPAGPARLTVLFVLSSSEYLRYFDSTIQLLADRGHRVLVGVNWLRERKHARLADLIQDRRVEILGAVPKRSDVWVPLARAVRGTMDFLCYLHPRFTAAPALRARMYRKVLPPVLRPLNRIRSLSEGTLARALRVLTAVERAIPVSSRLVRLIRIQRPDVILVSPLVDAASDQVDTVRAARALGVPVIAGIASWDNLTNKGLLRVQPDLVTVWNEIQKHEAVTLHGVPAERVAVTGAQLFDRWFGRQPGQPRAAFCRQVGLPDDAPFLLFTGSSVFIARSEVEVPFVRRWIEALRNSSDPRLRAMPVLIRPHPFNCEAWSTADFSDLGPVAIWPRDRYTPAAEASRASLFESLYFSDAIVGINTSAMIEAAILSKPVFSVLTPEFAGTQEGTLHFHYLLPERGGFLRVAASLAEHVAQLRGVLDAPASERAETERFVASFIRPHGLETPCTPVLAGRIERLGFEGPVPPEPDRLGARLGRVLLWPLAISIQVLNRNGPPMSDRSPDQGLLRRALRKVRRALHRVVHPEDAEERAQIDRLTRAVTGAAAAAAAERKKIDRVNVHLKALSARLSQAAMQKDVRDLGYRVERAREASLRQRHVLSQALKFASWDEELRVEERRITQRLARIAASDRPVLVGPWSGEVGFELLYWVPFVTWALRRANVAPERVVIVSRGGPASWYAHLGGRYVDVLSHVTPDQFRARTEQRKKQWTMGPFEREIVRTTMATAGLERPSLLHPGLMYRLFVPFWRQKATVSRVQAYTEYEPVRAPVVAALAGRLPERYVAVRFYFNASFPDTPANRTFVESTVGNLAATTHVVLLNTPFHVDDHRDFTADGSARVHTVADLMTPDTNLELQTAVIAGATAFVGTYGGYAYLAPLCGVPSLAFYSVRRQFHAHHLELAERVFRAMEAGSLVALDVRDAELVRMAMSSMPSA